MVCVCVCMLWIADVYILMCVCVRGGGGVAGEVNTGWVFLRGKKLMTCEQKKKTFPVKIYSLITCTFVLQYNAHLYVL